MRIETAPTRSAEAGTLYMAAWVAAAATSAGAAPPGELETESLILRMTPGEQDRLEAMVNLLRSFDLPFGAPAALAKREGIARRLAIGRRMCEGAPRREGREPGRRRGADRGGCGDHLAADRA